MVAGEELPDYYRLADVLVMPSTGEGFGIVFLEAMACGIDVIGGNQDGSIDPLGDGAVGSAIDPDDSEELVSAISAALRKPAGNVGGATRFNAAGLQRTPSSAGLLELHRSFVDANDGRSQKAYPIATSAMIA